MTEYRRAVPEDWRLYKEVRLRALRESPDAYSSTVQRESRFLGTTWRSRLASAHTLLALDGTVVVGTATGIPDRRNGAGREVVAMWVSPDARGKRIATHLLDLLADWARAEGTEDLVLWIADGNESAARAYAHAGFAPTGTRAQIRDGLGEELWARRL